LAFIFIPRQPGKSADFGVLPIAETEAKVVVFNVKYPEGPGQTLVISLVEGHDADRARKEGVRAGHALHEIEPAAALLELEADWFLHPTRAECSNQRELIQADPGVDETGSANGLSARAGIVFDGVGKIIFGHPLNVLVHGPIDADPSAAKKAAVLQLADAARAGLDCLAGGIPTRVDLQRAAYVDAKYLV